MDKIKCLCGYENPSTAKFCANCGNALGNVPPKAPGLSGGVPVMPEMPGKTGMMGMMAFMQSGMMTPQTPVKKEPVNVYPDDENLKVIVNSYHKIGPLPTGDRYRESVLYENEESGEYEIHTYASNDLWGEIHKGFRITKDEAKKIIRSVDHLTFKLKNNGTPPCGGISVVKYRNRKDELVRIECYTRATNDALSKVDAAFADAIDDERRIVPEYAKLWKKFEVFSTGAAQTSCYNYSIERLDDGRMKVSGNCFPDSHERRSSDEIILSENEKEAIDKIPVGLLISDIKVSENPIGMPVMQDGGSISCSVTYSDAKTDSKLADREITGKIHEIIKKVFERA